MKNTNLSKTALAFLFGLLAISFVYSTGCGSHGSAEHKNAKHGKAVKHTEQKPAPEVGEEALSEFYHSYLDIQKSFVEDNLKASVKSAEKLGKVAARIQGDEKHKSFLNHLDESIKGIAKAEDIEIARERFFQLSNLTISLLEHNEYKGDKKALVFHCPMAFDNQGADWLQSAEGTLNPYYGKSMLTCGSKTRAINN